jgi:hypothetical protein
MRPDESYAAPAEIRLLQRCRQDSPRQRLLACYEEVDAMTRILSAALVTTLVFAHLAAAQPSDPTEPSGTRLLVGPTARALEQGQFYVDFSAFVGGPFAQVGVTDRVSIGAGTPVLVPGIQPGGVMVVTPKVQVYAGRNVDASVGVLQFLGPQVTPAGIAYAVVTRGSLDTAVTGGVGVTYSSERRADGAHASVVMLGGEKRLTPRLKILTENYAGFGGGLLCGGLRLTRGRGTFDFGFAAVVGADRPLVAPIFRFAWNL